MPAAHTFTTIIQLSDCHLFADKTKTGYQGINPYQTLKNIVHTLVNSADIEPESLILVTGDISGDDSEQSYVHFCALVEPLLAHHTLRVIPGNHDNNPHYQALLGRWHLQPNEPIETCDWLIHGLDTRIAGIKGAKGEVKTDELTLIEKYVNSQPSKHHLLALHHHPIASDSWMDKHELMGSNTLLAWLAQQPAINGLLHGHIHHPLRRTTNDGVLIAGAPSTAWQWAMTQEFGVTEESAGYQIITLHNNGTFDCEVRRTQ